MEEGFLCLQTLIFKTFNKLTEHVNLHFNIAMSSTVWDRCTLQGHFHSKQSPKPQSEFSSYSDVLDRAILLFGTWQ